MCSQGRINHPRFARVIARSGNYTELSRHRRALLAGLHGSVVEIGAGAGANFAHYPATVSDVVAVEPEPHLRRLAEIAAADAPVRVCVVDALAESLPLRSASFDAAVLCLVLCSVAEQAAALGEVRRVLRPGGELRYYAHVAADSFALGWLQRLLDRTVWPRAFGGCRTSLHTSASIEHAGFEIVSEKRIKLLARPLDLPAAKRVLGVAHC
jgi:ubiquinone/menaquinone biosynthesis C-methylase UbiE